VEDEEWDSVVSEVDKDGNAEIDFHEFSIMMEKMMNVMVEGDEEDPDDPNHNKSKSALSYSS